MKTLIACMFLLMMGCSDKVILPASENSNIDVPHVWRFYVMEGGMRYAVYTKIGEGAVVVNVTKDSLEVEALKAKGWSIESGGGESHFENRIKIGPLRITDTDALSTQYKISRVRPPIIFDTAGAVVIGGSGWNEERPLIKTNHQ